MGVPFPVGAGPRFFRGCTGCFFTKLWYHTCEPRGSCNFPLGSNPNTELDSMSQAKNVNTTNRRAVLAGIAALPIAALPAIAAAATLSTLPSDVEPDGIDWAAVLGRAEHVVESLRTRHVCAEIRRH